MSNKIANVNLETGIRFGVISSNNINQGIFNDIFDMAWGIFSQECFDKALEEYKLYNPENAEDEEKLDDFERDYFDNFEPDEISAELEFDGLNLWLTTLGGAYVIYVLKSPYITRARLCSPCCPNAGNLDEIDLGNGFECYDVPPDWRELG